MNTLPIVQHNTIDYHYLYNIFSTGIEVSDVVASKGYKLSRGGCGLEGQSVLNTITGHMRHGRSIGCPGYGQPRGPSFHETNGGREGRGWGYNECSHSNARTNNISMIKSPGDYIGALAHVINRELYYNRAII